MKYLALALLLIASIGVSSQVSNQNLPPKLYYKYGKISMNNYMNYEGRQVKIKPDSISFINNYNQRCMNFALTDINYLRVRQGNQALKWCGFGAVLLGLTALLNSSKMSKDKNTINYVLAFTFTGAAVGGLIGSCIPRWKTYFLKN